MREQHAVQNLVAVAAAHGQHRGGEVAEAVDREDRGVLEGRDEEGAGDVGLVVLDAVKAGAQRRLVGAEGLGERTPRPDHLRGVDEPCPDVLGGRAMPGQPADLGAKVGAAGRARRRCGRGRPARGRRRRDTTARPRSGNPAQCLTRVKRSSSAAATSSPSTTSAAAASAWKALIPRIAVTAPSSGMTPSYAARDPADDARRSPHVGAPAARRSDPRQGVRDARRRRLRRHPRRARGHRPGGGRDPDPGGPAAAAGGCGG